MGRRDELQKDAFADVEARDSAHRERARGAIARMEKVPLSSMTVGDLLTIVRFETRGFQRTYTGAPSEREVVELEQIASKLRC